MSSSTSQKIKGFLVRWSGPAAVMIAIFIISAVLARRIDSGDLHAQIIWPERLSASTTGRLVVVARDHGEKNNPPAPGARVELFQMSGANPSDYTPNRRLAEQFVDGHGLRALATGETDALGHVVLELPPVSKDESAPGLRLVDGHHIALLLQITYQGDQRVVRRVYAPPAEAKLVLTTDRPLYQPGQTILIKALGVDPDSGRPIVGDLAWEVRDPRGNLVLKEAGKLSAAGIASVKLPLSSQCVQGAYRLRVALGAVSTEITADVRPFRLPRYKVTVEPDIGVLKPGEALAGKVRARFTYGDPVAEAETAMSVVFTRVNNRTETAEIKGKTDAEGVFRFSWPVPQDVKIGAALKVQAVVTSAAGRAERGKASVAVGTRALAVELLASGSIGWIAGADNKGFAIVTDGAGRPVVGARIALRLPEQTEEKRVNLTTDANGQAEFSWIPHTSNLTVRMEITPPEGETFKVDRRLNMRYGGVFMESASPTAAVGEPFSFNLRNFGDWGTVVAFNRGYPVAAAPVKRGARIVTVTMGPEARGLTLLRLLDHYGNAKAALPVWVVQRGGDKIAVKTDAKVYKPGSKAVLDMSFPPYVEEKATEAAPAVPVSFGLVGVDEALYALKERVQQPLAVLLRQDPGQVEAVVEALGQLERGGDADDLTQRVVASRFAQRFASSSAFNQIHGSDLTYDIEKMARRPFVHAWLLFLGLLVLVLAFFAGRATIGALTKSAFGWKRFFALGGVAFAALIVASIFAGASIQAMIGGLLVWSGVVICWVISAALRAPELKLSTWLWALLGMILLSLALVLGGSTVNPEDWVSIVLAVAIGLPAILLLVELGLWAMVLHSRQSRKPAFGLITFVGVLGGMSLASFGLTVGSSYAPDAMRYAEQKSAPSATGAAYAEEEADMEMKPGDELAKPGAKGNQQGQAEGGGPRVRSFFPETMVWLPEIASDAEGRARVTLDIPDSITTWRVEATASTWDGRFGDARFAVGVWQPFFVELELPTHLTAGDRLDVPVTLVNNRDEPLSVRLSAEGHNGLVVEQAPTQANVPARERQIIILSVLAERPGKGSVTISAIPSEGEGDAVRRTATVRPDGRELSASRSGLIRTGWISEFNVPGSALEGSAKGNAAIFPSAVSDAEDGLAGMLRGPTGCFEQTSSANYPNVMILRALRQTPPERWPGGKEAWDKAVVKARKFLALGYQKLMSFQLDGGGFSLYNARQSRYRARRPDIMLTAYGVMQLSEMATVYPVDEGVIRRAAQWLAAQQNQSGTWPVYAGRAPGGNWRSNDDAAQLRSTAFVAWSLLQSPAAETHKAAIDKALDHLAKEAGESGAPDTLALSVNALKAGSRDEDAIRIASRLAATARRQDDVAWWAMSWSSWMGGRGQYADLEATALAAYALLSVEAHGELLQPALRHLSRSRSRWGGWGTTQATLWTLRAFEKLRAIDSKGPVRLSVFLRGEPWSADLAPKGAPPGQLTIEAGDALVHRFSTEPLSAGAARVQVQPSASTAAMAQATTVYAVPWGDRLARVSGERLVISITTNFATIKRGGEVEVTAGVRNPARDAYGASIVELPLPPGAFADPDQFESWQKAGLIDTFEVLPTYVRLYLPNWNALQSRSFTYRFRPLVRGEFSLPPARAYLFYAPEPITEIDGGELRVE